MPIRLHEEDPALLREAIRFTSAETGFTPRLIEKDYFCSVILRHLTEAGAGLVFRGGTCLAKVHAGFYRLSEDLDFLIATPVDASRADRSRQATTAKRVIAAIGDRVPGLKVLSALRGANDSRHYAAVIGYASLLGPQEETIKIEVGLREPLLMPEMQGEVRTLLLDPVPGEPMVPVFSVTCLSRQEAMAEKLRAALSRREAAIRDFYDVDHAIRRQGLSMQDAELVSLVRGKLAVPGNAPVDVSAARLTSLRPQLESQLKPVLREVDFAAFDLDRAFASMAALAAAL